MRARPLNLTESYLMLFAIWGLGLAGMPAELDEEVSTGTTPPAVQQPLQGLADASHSRSVH